jgi:hypothetical protein
MKAEPRVKAVQVDGEVLALRCWACGTEHSVNVDQCTPEELAYMVCSQRNCGMSLFLVNELALDEQAESSTWPTEHNGLFAAIARLWI